MMLRSVTVSDNLHLGTKRYTVPYWPVVVIFITEFLVSSNYLCYGVYYALFVRYSYISIHEGLWTPVLFIASWNISEPWSTRICEYFSDDRKKRFRKIVCWATLLSSGSLMVASKINIRFQFLFYGIFAGIFGNLIMVQVRLITIEYFKENEKFLVFLTQIPKAIGLLAQPFCLIFLSDYYDIESSQFIMSAVILHIIPVCLLLKPKKVEVQCNLAKFKTFSGLSMPLKEIHQTSENISCNSATSSEDEAFEDELYGIEDHLEMNSPVIPFFDIFPSDSIHSYYRNIGVSILPEIPEEDEDVENIDVISSKRLSRISTKLEEINDNYRRESLKSMTINEKTLGTIQQESDTARCLIINNANGDEETTDSKNLINQENAYCRSGSDNSIISKNTLSFLKDIKSKDARSCYCCTPYRKFICRRKLDCMKDVFKENLTKPLYRSLKQWRFYIVLFSKTTLTIAATIFLNLITIVPYSIIESHINTFSDQVCLLSIIAFAWCFFLVGAPVVVKWSNSKFEVAYAVGLIFCSVSIYFLSRNLATDLVTLVCLLYGFGFGMYSYAEKTVYKCALGVIEWPEIKGTVETMSGIFVIILYFIIYLYQVNSFSMFVIILAIYSINALIWTVVYLYIFIVKIIQKIYRRNKNILV